MSAWHNEIEPYPADWTRNLIAAGLIPAGVVDERSIVDIRSADIAGYDTCHFFAGFGGWPYALRLAGWPETRPVWTGSCPCQPFSVAGKQAGFDDPRHLWPAWERLIAERLPPTIFGEQSAAAADWLDLVRSDLEALGYAVGCIPMEAASSDADHYRDRYWFVADLHEQCSGEGREQRGGEFGGTSGLAEDRDCGLADSAGIGRQRKGDSWRWGTGFTNDCGHGGSSDVIAGAITGGPDGMPSRARDSIRGEVFHRHSSGLLANGDGERSQIEIGKSRDIGEEQSAIARSGVRSLVDDPSVGWGEGWTEHEFRSRGFTAAVASIDNCQYIECPNGKWRRLPPPRVRWLGTGIPARIPKLRAIGNAIDHRPAVAFIQAYMKARGIASLDNREIAA